MLREHPEQIELVRSGRSLDPPIDIALYDHALRRQSNGPTLVQLLADPRIHKVVLYSWDSHSQEAAGLLGQGASAYLSKALASAELIEALRAVKNHQGWEPPRGKPTRAHRANQAECGEVLTDREAEMLRHVSRGHSNAEIAALLNLSINTVKSYIRSCYRKIDVDSRSKALLWGLRHGFGENLGTSIPESAPIGDGRYFSTIGCAEVVPGL